MQEIFLNADHNRVPFWSLFISLGEDEAESFIEFFFNQGSNFPVFFTKADFFENIPSNLTVKFFFYK